MCATLLVFFPSIFYAVTKRLGCKSFCGLAWLWPGSVWLARWSRLPPFPLFLQGWARHGRRDAAGPAGSRFQAWRRALHRTAAEATTTPGPRPPEKKGKRGRARPYLLIWQEVPILGASFVQALSPLRSDTATQAVGSTVACFVGRYSFEAAGPLSSPAGKEASLAALFLAVLVFLACWERQSRAQNPA